MEDLAKASDLTFTNQILKQWSAMKFLLRDLRENIEKVAIEQHL